MEVSTSFLVPRGQGRKVSFKNTIIIMTSNLGSSFILDMGQGNSEAVKDMVMTTVRHPIQPGSHLNPAGWGVPCRAWSGSSDGGLLWVVPASRTEQSAMTDHSNLYPPRDENVVTPCAAFKRRFCRLLPGSHPFRMVHQ